ncbi:MAG: TraR/DksA family transcriptional regulator [Saprospiraceae bacterium]|nr:TraR/DksA family transcriptional regulator [Saprospiraceae bacterium]
MVATTTARYSDDELQEFKKLIEEKLTKSRAEVQFLRQQMNETNENSANQQSGDWTDESSNHTQMEMLINSLGRQQHFMRNLENALLRIQNKTYGVCTLTGDLIPKERLRYVPHATKSIEAKNARPMHNTSTHAIAENAIRRNKVEEEQPESNGHVETAEMQKAFFENQ